MGDAGKAIAASWELEKTVTTDEEMLELSRAQLPMHFAGEPPAGFGEDTVFSPDVLRHFANVGYGDFDFVPYLHHVRSPTLVVVGENDQVTTPRAARVLHDGIADSELRVIPGAGHMTFVERRDEPRRGSRIRSPRRSVEPETPEPRRKRARNTRLY